MVSQFTERIFIQTRRLWCVCNQPIEAFLIVSRVTRILHAVNRKASIFVSFVIKEFAHAFSCAYIELWMHLRSLESTQEARVALSCVSSNSYASLLLSKLPACIHNSIIRTLRMTKSVFINRCLFNSIFN